MKYLLTLFLIIGCGSAEDGTNGVNCYDYLGDTNGDGEINSIDCSGAVGSRGENGEVGPVGPKGGEGAKGDDGEAGKNGTDGKDYVAPVPMEGYYLLPDGGYIEILQNEDGRYIIYGTQRIYTINNDLLAALHPALPAGPHTPHNGIIAGEYNSNYNSTTNDVEVDGGSSNISGVRKTVYRIWLSDSGKLQIKLNIFSSNGLSVVVNRTVESE